MSDDALLSASVEYGIVARSLPFKDKVLKGYLNATGVPLRNGNPNADFTPNISSCALTSNGYTAKVLWGRRDGSISIVSHPDTINKDQGPASVNTSEVRQEHENAVLDGIWAADGNAFVTAGSDGRVKVWTVEPFRCAWTSEKHLLGLEADAILRVLEDLPNGLVVAASRSGDIIIFSGLVPFDPPASAIIDVPLQDVQKLCISTRTSSRPDAESTLIPQPVTIAAFYFRASSPTRLSILACYQDQSHFYRFSVDLLSKKVVVETFGTPAFGIIRCIRPAFSHDPAMPSFIVAGTQLGLVSIYDWDTTSLSSDPLPASRHIELFPDAHVTSLAINSFVIVAGSSRCAIRVLDLLTFETLASFTAPMNNDDCDVRQIELTGDALMASVSGKVWAWRAGHFGSGGKGPSRIKGKGRRESHGKWFSKFASDSATWQVMTRMSSEQVEMRDQIAEFKEYFEEESHRPPRVSDAEHEQLLQLHSLGLSEREAVEYALMLSRDEELQRLQNRARDVDEEGVFDYSDESSSRQVGSDPSSPLSSSPTDYYSPPPPLRPSTSGSSSSSHGRFVPLASPSTSNAKLQVLPRFHPEPMEAGGLVGSLSDSRSVLPQGSSSSPCSPPRSYSQPLLGQAPVRSTRSNETQIRYGASFGKPNAWNKPLPGTGSTASTPTLIRLPPSGTNRERVEDLELELALELSLAEAQNGGGDT
jgi:WD40 repeat protein